LIWNTSVPYLPLFIGKSRYGCNVIHTKETKASGEKINEKIDFWL
jgi:hypothetical protein